MFVTTLTDSLGRTTVAALSTTLKRALIQGESWCPDCGPWQGEGHTELEKRDEYGWVIRIKELEVDAPWDMGELDD